jgi:PAS domain S-box-containing protein
MSRRQAPATHDELDSDVPRGTEEALRRERELNANIIDSSVDGIFTFDRELRYTVWNPAMERISGVPASDTLGRRAFDVFPFLRDIGEEWYLREALAGRSVAADDRPFTIASTGHSGFFHGRYTPLRNAAGHVVGGLAIIRDVTDLKTAQAQLLQAGTPT